ncbi:carboxypeptidase-like regulatory domain-containing protein [Ancylomarina sp. DW003]|nr:carboxypeptidase-like regulatory domain-containing protein [Ancylomarina sp. DW003]MDE5420687.1 carboxypeptidase-like regulatory domain-containing protein [Ancylomarina sp. DW003]
MRKLFFCCVIVLSLCFAKESRAQKYNLDSIFFTGAVMDQVDLKTLPYAHFSINKKQGGITNEYGRFSIWVSSGDTINYSYVGYNDVKVVVSDSLQQDDYLFGVFLAKDTIALQEVLILPRFGDFKEAFMNAKVNTPEYVRAKNNVNSATYEALTTRPTKMDAKANTDLLIRNHVVAIENKTMVPTEMTAGVSTTRTLPELKRLKRKRKMKIPDAMVTDEEIKILQQMYRYGTKKK